MPGMIDGHAHAGHGEEALQVAVAVELDGRDHVAGSYAQAGEPVRPGPLTGGEEVHGIALAYCREVKRVDALGIQLGHAGVLLDRTTGRFRWTVTGKPKDEHRVVFDAVSEQGGRASWPMLVQTSV
jgi:hypothetical protein